MRRLVLFLFCCLVVFVVVSSIMADKPRVEPIMPGMLIYDIGWLRNQAPFRVTFLIAAPITPTGEFYAHFSENPMLENVEVQLRWRINNGDWNYVFGFNKCIFGINGVMINDVIDCELRMVKAPKSVKEVEFEWWGRMPFQILP